MAKIKYRDIFEVDERIRLHDDKITELMDVITNYSVQLTQVWHQYYELLKKNSDLQNQIWELENKLKKL